MNIDALTRILDTRFNGRVWKIAAAPFEGSVPLAGFHVCPVAGQTVPAEADVLAWEADDTARQEATAAAASVNATRADIDTRIAAIERRQHRALREHALGNATAKARLQTIEDEIAALRAQRP